MPIKLPGNVQADWVYFATVSRANLVETRALAVDEGVICRTAHNKSLARIANVAHVRPGHTILLVFSTGTGGADPVGLFRVQKPAVPVGGAAALDIVMDSELSQRLLKSNYAVDPVAGRHTVFRVKREPAPGVAAVGPIQRPGNNALWRVGR